MDAPQLFDFHNKMKQRITYVVNSPDDFSPEQLLVKDDGNSSPRFAVKGVDAAKEHRITLGLKELPEEVQHNLILRLG